jgi:hypothetical protein
VLWSVETAAHCDWPVQARVVEVVESGDTVVLRLTLVDTAGPVTREEVLASRDPVLRLAGIQRELGANDPQHDYTGALGPREARNVELTAAAPFPFRGPVVVPPPVTGPAGGLPPTGIGPEAAVAGALALAGAAALRRGLRVQPSGGEGGAAELGVGDEIGM